jgi:uncharacterized protein YdaT
MDTIITQIQQLKPNLQISTVQLEDGDSLNDVWLKYGVEGITHALNSYPPTETLPQLEFLNGYKISFKGKAATYIVIGLTMDMQNMKVTLNVIDRLTDKKHRLKVDLFEFAHVQHQCRELSEKQRMDYNLLEADLTLLTDLLEQHRDKLIEDETNPITDLYSEKELTPKASEKAVEFLSKPQLLENIDKLLEQSGIVGEQDNRRTLFVIASSYKMPYLLHGLIQGTSGEGKSHLLNSIGKCMPQEDTMSMTRITNKHFYHYNDKELYNKLILIQDFDGVEPDAQYAFREMQSAGFLDSQSVGKDHFGNLIKKQKRIRTHFASLIATTKAEIYYDNMSRSVVVGVDESQEQTMRIIHEQNRRIAGKIDDESEEQAKQLLRNCMRVLRSYEIINPFADKLVLPLEAKMLRRLNSQFQNFVSQITLLHQYQRKTDDKGRLITTKEDIRKAVDVFFNAIIIKVDELDGSTRQFFEKMKLYVRKQTKGTTHRFSVKEIRQEMNIGNSTAFKYFKILRELEYVQVVEGSENKGFKYIISHWDDMAKIKSKVRENLNRQLDEL